MSFKNTDDTNSHTVDLITLDESSESISIEENINNSEEKVDQVCKNKEGNTNGNDSHELEVVTLNEYIPIKENNHSQEKIDKMHKNKEENRNGNDPRKVEIITLNESSENIPFEGNNDSQEISWELDEEGEGRPENEEEKVETNISSVSFDVPNYSRAFTGYLTEKEFSMLTGEHIKNDECPSKSCFNCLGNHGISECKEKKDFVAIARNRRSILGKKAASIRYHEDVENKFSNFKAGEISDSLRQALGLRNFEAPDYIYRMRILGYPPGWLKEAEAKRSEMSLYDGTGKPLSHPEEEEGETDVRLIKYHPEKLISFPGFNVPFPTHIEDQHRQLNYPTMQEHHSKETFLQFMTMNKASKYKRKKLRNEVPQSANDVKTAGDMEVEDLHETSAKIEFNPPLPEETPKPPEPPPLPLSPVPEREDGELSEDSNEKTYPLPDSPPTTTPDDESPSTKPSIMKRRLSNEEGQQASTPKTTLETKISTSIKRQHKSSSKGFTLGVTIPESITPYKILPDFDKWNVDVSDHILFDNLPDALGTWKKMRGLMSSVRDTMKEIHADEEN